MGGKVYCCQNFQGGLEIQAFMVYCRNQRQYDKSRFGEGRGRNVEGNDDRNQIRSYSHGFASKGGSGFYNWSCPKVGLTIPYQKNCPWESIPKGNFLYRLFSLEMAYLIGANFIWERNIQSVPCIDGANSHG